MKTTKPCHCCDGTGREPDQVALGARLRQARQRAGLSLRKMAENLKVSAPYLCDLELGRRHWSPKLTEAFLDWCDMES